MTDTRKGGCLCGAVRYEAEIETLQYHVCHCSTCRQWGAPGMACPVSSLTVTESASLKHHSSSDHAERGFCSDCGGHIYWRLKDGNFPCVHIGTLDKSDDLEFATQLFVEQKPEHYAYKNETKMVTGEELFAMFK